MSALTYGWHTKDADSFWLRFKGCEREPKSWKEEIYASARAISTRTDKPIWVCSSGGIDSEIACRAFYDQGLPFSVLTLQHDTGTNLHDISYAIEWCKTRGVVQKIVKIDMHLFLTTEVEAYAKRYAAIHPFRYFQIKLMEMVEEMQGFAVLCSGEQLYTVDQSKPSLRKEDIYLPLSNGTAMPLDWCKDNKTSHEPYFHFSTPELCLSYIRLSLVSYALNNPDLFFRHPANKYAFKGLTYQSIWTDLKARYKLDGYENIGPIFNATRERLMEKFSSQYVACNVTIPDFEAQLTGTC